MGFFLYYLLICSRESCSFKQAPLKMLLGSPVGLEHLEEYLCEKIQKNQWMALLACM